MARKILVIILIALNAGTFIWVGKDKNIAATANYRTSENVLIRMSEVKLVAVTAFGSAPGALIGFKVFKHKTSDSKSYLRQAEWLVLLQNILSYVVLFYLTRKKDRNKFTRSMLYGQR